VVVAAALAVVVVVVKSFFSIFAFLLKAKNNIRNYND